MNRLVTVLGTLHRLQNGEKDLRRVDDPQFKELLDILVAEDGIDFIFEEATGLGPTTAEKLALTWGPDRYLDVDPPRRDREKFGIPENTNEPFMLGSPVTSPPTAVFADRHFHEAHAKREEYWLQQIAKRDFKKALMVCGENHTLSFAFRLVAANFNVKTFTYAPSSRLASQTQSGESKMDTISIHSMLHGKYGEGGSIRVEIDTTEDGISDWAKHFPDARDLQTLLLELAPMESTKIMDFTIQTRNFGEGHIVISCEERDFSKYGFEKLPPA